MTAVQPLRLTVMDPGCGWINANDSRMGGKGFYAKNRKVRAWREAAAWEAKVARLPMLERAHILALLRFHTAQRRDPANWHPTVKAIVDGIVRDAGMLLPDDDAAHLDGPDLRIGMPLMRGTALRVDLVITPGGKP